MYQPLADLIRPQTLDDVCGQTHILGPNGLLRRMISAISSVLAQFGGVMLAFALVILSGMFMESTLLSDSSRLWDLLEIGLGGYVIGRSGEKVTDCLLSRKWK